MKMKLNAIAREMPIFVFDQYFIGHTKASGWFTDRFGNIRRHFYGDFFGSQEGDEFVLDEVLYYVGGMVEKRQWRVSDGGNGHLLVNSTALIGEGSGVYKGNTLYLRYKMQAEVAGGKIWTLDLKDYMIYQPDHSLHNAAYVYKWGVRIGTVTTQYTKHDGELQSGKLAVES